MRTRFSWLAFLLSTLLAHGETTLLPRGSVWKYHPFEVPPNWTAPDFDDSTWDSGPAQLGYGDGDEQTIVYDDAPAFDPTTVYFRRAFFVTNRADLYELSLRLVADDGAIVYLNGQELLRRNMPPGPVDASTEALTNLEVNENRFEQFAFSFFTLLQGTNFVCAEVHQYGPGRGDCSFDLELAANLPVNAPQVSITSPRDGALLSAEDFLIETEASDPASRIVQVDFYTNQVLLAAAANEPFNLIWEQPPKGGYAITARAFNEFGFSTDSEPVHVYVGTPVNAQVVRGPYLQSGSSTGMVVRWRTDWYSDARVGYGTNAGQMQFAVTDASLALEHEIHVTGLQPNTTYYYSVGASTQILAAGDSFYFRTSPTNAGPVRLWVAGDSGTADAHAEEVRDAYYGFNAGPSADLFLMLGDNAYGSGLDWEYQKAVFRMYPELLRHTPMWPTLGNHDAGDDPGDAGNHGKDYLNIFSLPKNGESGGVASGSELYYSFDYANIHVVCLDSFLSSRATNGPMLSWLASDLAATEKDWIIAFWHHPPYAKGTHDSDAEPDLYEMRARALPILEAYGVDLVLSGHSHAYERTYLLNGHYGFSPSLEPSMILDQSLGSVNSGGPYHKPAGGLGANRGAVYVVCGCSGEGGLDEGFTLHPAMALNHGGFGSMVIDVNGLQLTARFLRPSQTVDDIFAIDKSLPSSTRPRVEITSGTNGPVVSWPTSDPLYGLESSDVVTGQQWQPVSLAPQTAGRRRTVTIAPENPRRFFRLRSEP